MGYINNIEPVSYIAGQIADSNPYSIISNPNVFTAPIPFGVAMILTAQGYSLPTLINDITKRMAVNTIINRNKFYQNDAALNPLITGNVSVPVGSEAAGLTMGYIAVVVEESVVLGDSCFIRFASGAGGTQLGAFRASADTATAEKHTVWYYASAATAGSIAIVCVK